MYVFTTRSSDRSCKRQIQRLRILPAHEQVEHARNLQLNKSVSPPLAADNMQPDPATYKCVRKRHIVCVPAVVQPPPHRN